MKTDRPREKLLEIQRATPTSDAYHNDNNAPTVESLPEPVRQNIETIIQLETEHGRQIPTHHRVIERIASSFGQPKFLYSQIVCFSAWWLCSHLSSLGILPKDFPKFNLRSDGLNVSSLLITTGVLVYQRRQEQLAEERSHLMLQIDLLSEQKIVKIIELLEELRADLPNVEDRHDPEVEQMQQPIDPQALLVALKESLNPDDEDEDEDDRNSTTPQPQANSTPTLLEPTEPTDPRAFLG
jgi:uncharacterized membrane protein